MNLKGVREWHLWVLWPALIITTIYIVSAFAHPLMAWTGPQAQTMFPPSLRSSSSNIQAIGAIIEKHDLQNANIAKLIPFQNDVLFQVTHNANKPRRYFSLSTLEELPQQDQQQAIWLAQHYTGLTPEVSSIEFKTEFDEEYPWVNRLLPVYKINFNTDDNLSVFIHTETQALSGINNDWKRILVFIFRHFHSFDWLDELEPARISLVMGMMIVIMVMAITGLLFLTGVKRKKNVADIRRRWHRRLAWIAILPMLMFTLSGIYHLFQMALVTPETGIRLSQTLDLSHWRNAQLHLHDIDKKVVNQISLVSGDAPMYRVSYASTENKLNDRVRRFKGMSKESDVQYIHALTGETLGNLDIALVEQQAKQLLSLPETTAIEKQLITRFGPTYDFRNKRLPVWQVNAQSGDHVLFIDPTTHILVDQTNQLTRAESYSFSFLHKWNMLIPAIGRFNRDMLIMGILSISFVLVILGLLMHQNRKKKRLNHIQTHSETATSQKQEGLSIPS